MFPLSQSTDAPMQWKIRGFLPLHVLATTCLIFIVQKSLNFIPQLSTVVILSFPASDGHAQFLVTVQLLS